ncbi:MAG TPA: proton-conducting transporter membrane subunit [Mycobacteriales bacterium]|nr:proton-conducting transporter membrane subunit [Mycobacteriales bacterium]
MTGALVISGLCLIALGGALAATRRTWQTGLTVAAAGAAVLGIAGFVVLAEGSLVGSPFTSHFSPRFGIDPLSGLFLGTLGIVAAPALCFSRGYLPPTGRSRALGGVTTAFVLALIAEFCARDPVTLLAGWELMTLLPAAAILIARDDRPARQSVFTYLAVTHLGGGGTWIAILLLAKAGAIGGGTVLHAGSGLQAAVAVAALIGLGTKAGVMPLHVWLPRAHPIAPAPVSALMSGVMIKVSIYLLVRVLVDWAGPLPLWIGIAVTALGALSAVGGVTYALFEHDLKRLLAMHSIENIGIIVLGIGACLLLRSRGGDAWAAIALAAALLHTVNHAMFKSLLFLCAGAFERAVGVLELDRLGGLLRRMPVTGAAFFLGAMAIAGLPPLNGFASEWLTLQALVHIPRYGRVVDGMTGMVGLGALAATAALAMFCFVKVIGLVLLGPPRHAPAPGAAMPSAGMSGSVVLLAGGCVLLGVAPGVLFGRLVGLAPWAVNLPTAIGLHVPGTGSLPTAAIAALLVVVPVILVRLRGNAAAVAVPTWVCGQAVVTRLHWTSAGFTKPLRLALEPVLRPQRDVATREHGGVVQEITYTGRVPHLIEERVYAPALRRGLSAAAQIRRLQSGSLGTYAAYLIGLLLVLLLAARLGLAG